MNAELEDRVREMLGVSAVVSEGRMFGGLCFMLNGNMQICVRRDGSLLARVGADNAEKVVKRPGVERMVMRGKEMADYVIARSDAWTDKALHEWVSMTGAYVGAMPEKASKKAR